MTSNRFTGSPAARADVSVSRPYGACRACHDHDPSIERTIPDTHLRHAHLSGVMQWHEAPMLATMAMVDSAATAEGARTVNPDKPRVSRIAAYGLVQRERRLVLCRLSPQIVRFAGQWTLPGGGVEFGEHPAAAMVREVHEETGLQVRPLDVAGIDSICRELDDHAFHAVRIIYHTEIVGGALTHELEGSTDRCDWWHLDDVESLDIVDLVHIGLPLARARAPRTHAASRRTPEGTRQGKRQ
jgi:8-oxo-dGTP diphosphatase